MSSKQTSARDQERNGKLGGCGPSLVMLTRIGCSGWVGLTVLHSSSYGMRCIHSSFGSIQIGLLLELANVLLVTDPLVAKPIRYLVEKKKKGGGVGRGEGRVSDVKVDEALCTIQCDHFKLFCSGPSSWWSPASCNNFRVAQRLIKQLSDRACALLCMRTWHALCLSTKPTHQRLIVLWHCWAQCCSAITTAAEHVTFLSKIDRILSEQWDRIFHVMEAFGEVLVYLWKDVRFMLEIKSSSIIRQFKLHLISFNHAILLIKIIDLLDL